nr:protein cms1 [Quercus suber]
MGPSTTSSIAMADPNREDDSISSPEPPATLNKAIKRKRDEDTTASSIKKAKKQKQRKSKKPKDVDDGALDVENGINHAIAHMDSRLLADHLAQRTKRFQPDLSIVEVDEWHISGMRPAEHFHRYACHASDCSSTERAIKDTTSFEKNRTTADLPAYLELFSAPRRKKKHGPTLSEAPDAKGSPHTLVVAGAGLRAADLTRALRGFQTKESLVAKLFAKHIKLSEAVELVKKSRIGVGVGTPQRIIDLLEDGALRVEHLEMIVVDASHIDQKKRGILDMKETQVPLLQLLRRTGLKERYESEDRTQKIELLFF